MGFIAHIGNPEISKNKNLYYSVKVQVTKMEYTTIRFLVKGSCPNAAELILIKKEKEEKGNSVIVLQKVFKSDDTSFSNMELGSKYIFQNNILPFQPTSLTTSINEINNHTSGCFHVSVWIKWMSDVKQISSTSKCRKGVLIDDSGEIMVTMWRESLLCTEENVWFYCY